MAGQHPTEIELKFLLPPGARALVEGHPQLAEAPPTHERLQSTYFDTPSFALRRCGLSLRVRHGPHGWMQTLKGSGGGTIGVRDEWEWPLQDGEPDFSRLIEAGVGEPLVMTISKRGKPVFATDIERTERHVRLNGAATVAAAIDEGTVNAGNSMIDIHEVELELKEGPITPAFRLAMDLARIAPLRVNGSSKADVGYALVTGRAPEPAKANAPDLPRGMSVAEAVPALVSTTLRQFVANIPAAEAAQVEGVHQMRVALRRLRTLLVLFAPELEPYTRERLNDAIRTLGTPLGEARDWDVFVTETLLRAELGGVRPEWLALFRRAGEARRRSAHEGVKEMIAGRTPTDLVLGIGAWVTGEDWAGVGRRPPARKLRAAAPRLLGRMERKVRKRSRGMPDLSGDAMHAMRKAVKKLRYGVESVRPLYKKRAVNAYAKPCKTLQSLLGAINDAAVTARLTATVAPADDAAWAPAAGALLAWNKERSDRCQRDAGRAWRRFQRCRPFWT
jgi:triphosphatase